MKFKTELENAAYALAMLGLQSNRYVEDPDYKDAVDAVLGMTLLRDANTKPDMSKPEPRTLASDLAEDR